MKKISALIIAAALSLSLAACSSNPDNNSNSDTIDSATYRVGVGSYTVTEDSTSSLEGENGRGVVSTTYVTVIFDENNIIRKAYIDEVESKVYFDAYGQLVENSAYNDIRSKRELGDEYNMKPASSIGKEWYEQVNSIESWLVGKNIDDISNGVMNNGMYGNNDYSDSVTGGVEGAVDGMMDGAESMIDGVVGGVESALDGTAANDGTNAGNQTMSGATGSDSGSMSGSSGNMNGGAADSSSNSGESGTDSNSENGASGNSSSSGTNGYINWEEDLKASATIDMTNMQIALQKAYRNAR